MQTENTAGVGAPSSASTPGTVKHTSPSDPTAHVRQPFVTPRLPTLFEFDLQEMEERLVKKLVTDSWPGCFPLPGKDNRRRQ